jgi:antitoxin ParD1/3/4
MPNFVIFFCIEQELPMATMNISLPDPMKSWVESQTDGVRYANSSDYIRDLIRRDQERSAKIAHWQGLIDEARASGVSDLTMEDIRQKALDIIAQRKKSA